MHMKEGDVDRYDVADRVGVKEEDMYKAKNTDDPKKPCAEYWDGITHPETGEKLKLDHEYHEQNSGECLYAQFRDGKDSEGNKYHYIKNDDLKVEEQVNEDRKLEQEQGRGR